MWKTIPSLYLDATQVHQPGALVIPLMAVHAHRLLCVRICVIYFACVGGPISIVRPLCIDPRGGRCILGQWAEVSLTPWVYMSFATICLDSPRQKRKGPCCSDNVDMPPEAEIRGNEQSPPLAHKGHVSRQSGQGGDAMKTTPRILRDVKKVRR